MGSAIPAQPWTGLEGQWDHIQLAGKDVPGLAKVTVKRANKWDKKKAKGTHKSTKEFGGVDDAIVTVHLRIWTKDDWDLFVSSVLPDIEPKAGKKTPDSVAISHPVTDTRGISLVVVDDIEGPEVTDGCLIMKISCTEHELPDKKNATGSAGYAGAKKASGCAALLQMYQQNSKALADAQNDEHGLNGRLRTAQQQSTRNAANGVTNDFTSSEIADLNGQLATNKTKQSVATQLIQVALQGMTDNKCPPMPQAGPGSFAIKS
jgi:hypothetical protein